MVRAVLFALCFALTSMSSPAGALDTATANAIRDSERAQRSQAESLRSIERVERDRARAERNERHNAEVLSRSMRRFDR